MDKPKTLNKSEVEEGLKNLPGWKFEADPAAADAERSQGKISKEFEFKDFLDSLGFVNKMAPIFEANDHHPDTHILYSKVLFELQRFDMGGVITDRDFFIAGEIEKNYSAR